MYNFKFTILKNEKINDFSIVFLIFTNINHYSTKFVSSCRMKTFLLLLLCNKNKENMLSMFLMIFEEFYLSISMKPCWFN